MVGAALQLEIFEFFANSVVFRKSHVTYHFKALCKLANVVPLEIRISRFQVQLKWGKYYVSESQR